MTSDGILRTARALLTLFAVVLHGMVIAEEEGFPTGEHGGQVIDLDAPEGPATGIRAGVQSRQGIATRARQQLDLPTLPEAWDAHRAPPAGTPAAAGRSAGAVPAQRPSAESLHEMMGQLASGNHTRQQRDQLVAEIFANQDIYREAVMFERFKAVSPGVEAFMDGKADLQRDVIRRMGEKHKARHGRPPDQPIIPFGYNNVFSDDDIITGSGRQSLELEQLYNEALSEIIEERTGRPMTASDRARVDVNGLGWNMRTEGGVENFDHPEKYVNPQSGFANQAKLAESGALVVYSWDEDGNMVALTGDDARAAVESLDVDRPLPIEGVNPKQGAGSVSDYVRMAHLHQVPFEQGRVATAAEMAQFIRNQKYTGRVEGDYQTVASGTHPDIGLEHAAHLDLARELRGQTNIRGLAGALDGRYGERIIVDGEIDRAALTRAMARHQEAQLANVLPDIQSAVMENEAYKLARFLEGADGPAKHLLRKQLALTYAPVDAATRTKLLSDLDRMKINAEQKAFLRQAIDADARRLVRYAQLVDMDVRQFVNGLSLRGDSFLAVDLHIMNYQPVQKMGADLWHRPGGAQFKEFLRSKTARALNLDVMLSADIGARGEKVMQWSMLLLTASRAYAAGADQTEAYKCMALGLFEMVPGVSAVLRFSEGEFRQSFKDLTMDVLPPLALADLAVQALRFTGDVAQNTFTESVLDGLARTQLAQLRDEDFEASPDIPGYYRLRNREALIRHLDDIAPGMGRIAKFPAVVSRYVDALVQSDPNYAVNLRAMHMVLHLEPGADQGIEAQLESRYSIADLRAKVWRSGIPGFDEATPAQRVAARIIADNLSIRAGAFSVLLQRFADRIEALYNAQRDTDDEHIVDVLLQTETRLREMYRGAPREVLDSAFAAAELEHAFDEREAYLDGYDVGGKTLIDVQRDMQALLDGFRALIEQLRIASRYFEEGRALDLRANYYGGDHSMEPLGGDTADPYSGGALVMGDEFRIGISARVSRHRQSLPWTVFYYVLEERQLSLLGQVALRPQGYAEGDGLMVIEAPDESTFLHIKGEVRSRFFGARLHQQVYPVLAFGDWPTDPVRAVGLAALNAPIEYFDRFAEDRIAFVGQPLSVLQAAPHIALDVPAYVEAPQAELAASLYVAVPAYAQGDVAEATLSLSASDTTATPPQLADQRIGDVSTDPHRPSSLRVLLGEGVSFGHYTLEATVRLRRVRMDDQPRPVVRHFRYAPELLDTQTQAMLDAALARLMRLATETQAIAARADTLSMSLIADAQQILEDLDQLAQDAEAASMGPNSTGAAEDRLRLLDKDAYADSERLARLRSRLEQVALNLCEGHQSLQDGGGDAPSIVAAMDANGRELPKLRTDFEETLTRLSGLRGEAEKLRQAAGAHTGEAGFAERVAVLEQRLAEARRRLEDFEPRIRALGSLETEAKGKLDEAQATMARLLDNDSIARAEEWRPRAEALLDQISVATIQTQQRRTGAEARRLMPEQALLRAADRVASVSGKGEGASTASASAYDTFLATYEAGMLFADPAQFALFSAETCWDASAAARAAGHKPRDSSRIALLRELVEDAQRLQQMNRFDLAVRGGACAQPFQEYSESTSELRMMDKRRRSSDPADRLSSDEVSWYNQQVKRRASSLEAFDACYERSVQSTAAHIFPASVRTHRQAVRYTQTLERKWVQFGFNDASLDRVIAQARRELAELTQP